MKLFTLSLFTCLAFGAIQMVSAEDKKEVDTEKAKPYPLKVCIVSGEPLNSMGKPSVMVYKGQEVKFCCVSCQPSFKKNPQEYLKKLEDA